jgi:hypothetical protein
MKRKTKILKVQSTKSSYEESNITYNSKYDSKYDIIAYKLALKGLKNKEIYEILNITEPTGIHWKRDYPSFKESINKGRKELKNVLVEKSLMKLAIGFHSNTQKALVVSDGKDLGAHVEKVTVKEYNPPQIQAVKYFLNNRKPEKDFPGEGWSEKQSLEIGNLKDDEPFMISIE